VMEDWSASYFLPLLSPLLLLFSDRFLPVRPLFCMCFILLWPSAFARLLCIISVLASVFFLWSLVQCSLCIICVSSGKNILSF